MQIVESDKVIVSGQAVTFSNTLTKDGATYNLPGKTVVATIRAYAHPETLIDAQLEDMPVTVPAGTGGAVTLAVGAALTALLSGPAPAAASTPYLLQYKISTDAYYPQALAFGVRAALD